MNKVSSFFTDDTSSIPAADLPEKDRAHSEGLGSPSPSDQLGTAKFDGSGVNVVVIDPDDITRNRILAQLGEDVSSFSSTEELLPFLNGEPVVMILGPSCVVDGALVVAEQVLRDHREIGGILVTEELTTNLLQQALRAGVKDVLAAPVDRSQLTEAIARVTPDLVGKSAEPLNIDDTPEDDGELAHVITVFSTKGGAGKSVIATNLGVLLAERSDKPVCLVDADLQFGDIAVMLKLAPQHTIVDAVSSLDRLDASLLQNLLITHESSGLKILAAPLEPAFADQIGAAEMVQIIEVLKRFCSYVIVDTPAYFNDVVLGMIEVSDDVLLVAGMDIPQHQERTRSDCRRFDCSTRRWRSCIWCSTGPIQR